MASQSTEIIYLQIVHFRLLRRAEGKKLLYKNLHVNNVEILATLQSV